MNGKLKIMRCVTGNGERVKDRLPGREDMVGVTTKDN